jgi:hypothetical protein
MTVGLAWLVDHYLSVTHVPVWRLWPVPLLVVGIARVAGGLPRRHRSDGAWLAFLGGWLLLNTLTDWQFRETWPVLIMFLGVKMIWHSLAGYREPHPAMERDHYMVGSATRPVERFGRNRWTPLGTPRSNGRQRSRHLAGTRVRLDARWAHVPCPPLLGV